jgi:hypothetical protein
MMKETFYWVFIGVMSIIILDILGSVASRIIGFKYVYLAPLSFAIYTFISFMITREVDWKIAILIVSLLGVFDATIGWKLSVYFRANMDIKYQITMQNVLSMAFLTTIFAIIGSIISLKFFK